MGVNNLPKVVTRQRGGRESNLQPSSYKCNAVTTKLLTRGSDATFCQITFTTCHKYPCKSACLLWFGILELVLHVLRYSDALRGILVFKKSKNPLRSR